MFKLITTEENLEVLLNLNQVSSLWKFETCDKHAAICFRLIDRDYIGFFPTKETRDMEFALLQNKLEKLQ